MFRSVVQKFKGQGHEGRVCQPDLKLLGLCPFFPFTYWRLLLWF